MVYASLGALSTEIFIAAQARRGIESIEEQPAIGPLCGSKRKFFSRYGIVLVVVVVPDVWIFEASIGTTSTPVPGYQGPAAGISHFTVFKICTSAFLSSSSSSFSLALASSKARSWRSDSADFPCLR
jgi:hypothetical protein